MIDKVIIMGLDLRKDLWGSLAFDCVVQHGFDTEVFISGDGSDKELKYDHVDVPGIPDSWKWGRGLSAQRHYWAFQSHKQIIKKAIKSGYENILLLEDDAVFTSRFNREWNNIKGQIGCISYDIIYLGWHAFEYNNHKFAGRNIEIEEYYKTTGDCHLSHIKQCGGLFGCIINKSIFPLMLNMPAVAPIDHQLNLYDNFIKRFNVIPSIIYVKSCFSNCENTYIERNVL